MKRSEAKRSDVNSISEAKRMAAIASAGLVTNGQVLGLGSGTTVNYMIEELGRKIREEQIRIFGIPTSNQTAKLATEQGIPLTTLDECLKLDLAIDGADQVDQKLNLIKGMGGALTREKIVDRAAEKLVIIVDESKITTQLGVNQVVPVEVIPFARAVVMNELTKMGGKPLIRIYDSKNNYFITDNGNIIIDVDFGTISDAKKLEMKIKMIPGVVESGLFVDMTDIVFVGSRNNVYKIRRRDLS